MRKQSSVQMPSARGEWWKPLTDDLQATCRVAREDRDGCSRYRASKMSAFTDELGWYREYIFLAPIFGGGGLFFIMSFRASPQTGVGIPRFYRVTRKYREIATSAFGLLAMTQKCGGSKYESQALRRKRTA